MHAGEPSSGDHFDEVMDIHHDRSCQRNHSSVFDDRAWKEKTAPLTLGAQLDPPLVAVAALGDATFATSVASDDCRVQQEISCVSCCVRAEGRTDEAY